MLFPAAQATDLEGQMDSFDVDSLERQIFGDAQLTWQDFRGPSDDEFAEVSSVVTLDPRTAGCGRGQPAPSGIPDKAVDVAAARG
jgi:hypothetical protein